MSRHAIGPVQGIIVGLALLGAGGCYHRDMATCQVDSVRKAVLAADARGQILVLHETVFQKTSESRSGGITHITGETETRLTAYDLTGGGLLARASLGAEREKGAALLGVAAGRLWVYSVDPALGLHARDPRTLQVRLTQERILAASPGLAGNLFVPAWSGIAYHVAFDPRRNRLLVTDLQGFRWEISPDDLRGRRLPGGTAMPGETHDSPISSSASFRGENLSMASDLRHTLELDGRPLAPSLSYLEGGLLMETDPVRALERLKRERELAERRLAELRTAAPAVGGEGRMAESDARSEARLALREQERRAESLARDLEQAERDGRLPGSGKPLQPGDDSFYVVHRGSLAPDARMRISRLELPPAGALRERWTREIPRVFFDPSASQSTPAFKALFSGGDPDFDFRCFAQRGNRLIMVYMLHAVCLDSDTGRVIWVNRL